MYGYIYADIFYNLRYGDLKKNKLEIENTDVNGGAIMHQLTVVH